MDEKLVERVARSVFIAMGHEPEEWAANPTAQAVAIKVARAAITAYLSARSAEPVAWVVTDEDGNVLDFEKLAPFTALPAGGHNLYAHPKEAPDV